jgi:hypothetical protein
MPTLILTPRYTADTQALWRAANHLGWQVERLRSWRVPEDLRSVAEPILYLEPLMAQTSAEQFGIRLLEPQPDWLPNLPQEYRKRWIYLVSNPCLAGFVCLAAIFNRRSARYNTCSLCPKGYFLLPSAFCLLPSAFCLLPSAFCHMISDRRKN